MKERWNWPLIILFALTISAALSVVMALAYECGRNEELARRLVVAEKRVDKMLPTWDNEATDISQSEKPFPTGGVAK